MTLGLIYLGIGITFVIWNIIYLKNKFIWWKHGLLVLAIWPIIILAVILVLVLISIGKWEGKINEVE